MKKKLCLLLIIISSLSVNAQYFPVDTGALKNAYRELIKNPNDAEVQWEFFNLFPYSFEELMMVYGFVPNDDYDRAMCYLSHEHVLTGLGEYMTLIPDSVYFEKLIRLSYHGYLAFDAPAYLSSIIQKKTIENPDLMFSCLSKKEEGLQFLFWLFYHSQRYVQKEGVDNHNFLCDKMSKKYPKTVELMKIAYNVAYGKSIDLDNFRKKTVLSSDDKHISYNRYFAELKMFYKQGEDMDIYLAPEVFPMFLTADVLNAYLKTQIKYPEDAKRYKLEGSVICSCIIEKDGSVNDVQILRMPTGNVIKVVDPLLEAEAIRVVSGMPKWKPGMVKGKAVRVKVNIPVNFKL